MYIHACICRISSVIKVLCGIQNHVERDYIVSNHVYITAADVGKVVKLLACN